MHTNAPQAIPFERARIWSQLAPHPLLQHTGGAVGGELLVQAALGRADLSYLLDHRVRMKSLNSISGDMTVQYAQHLVYEYAVLLAQTANSWSEPHSIPTHCT